MIRGSSHCPFTDAFVTKKNATLVCKIHTKSDLGFKQVLVSWSLMQYYDKHTNLWGPVFSDCTRFYSFVGMQFC